MKIKNLEPQKYKRFFAFGCSFTEYKWPTWADFIGKDIEFYENWGLNGRGNHFIFNSIIECDAKNHFTKDDLVIVMWSKIYREDRYHKNNWLVATENQMVDNYGKDWVNKFAGDERGNLIRDLAMVKAIQDFLNSRSCDWANLLWAPIVNLKPSSIDIVRFGFNKQQAIKYWADLADNLIDKNSSVDKFICPDVVNTYRDIFVNFEKSMYGAGLHKEQAGDPHPLPKDHLYYLNYLWPNNTLSESSKKLAHWDLSKVYDRKKINRL